MRVPDAACRGNLEYRATQSKPAAQLHADRVANDLSEREAALRRLPVPYSLALRLREAGVAREVICEYVGIEDASLGGFYRIAEEKLIALQEREVPAAAAARDVIKPK